MSSFDERQKGFEKKFAHDQELQFKVSARRNKYVGQWASKILGYNEEKEKEYIQSVIKADFAEAGDEDVFRKVKEDLKNHNILDEDIETFDELIEAVKIRAQEGEIFIRLDLKPPYPDTPKDWEEKIETAFNGYLK